MANGSFTDESLSDLGFGYGTSPVAIVSMPVTMVRARRALKRRIDYVLVPPRIFQSETPKIDNSRKAILQSCEAETVHDLRVSIRKLRTAIRLFWPILSAGARALDIPLRELFKSLGEVRNLDIALVGCECCSPGLRPEIRARLSEIRSTACQQLMAALTGATVLESAAVMAGLVSIQPEAQVLQGTDNPICLAHSQVLRSFRKLEGAWDIAEIHRLRRRIKRLRYAVEFLTPEFGEPAKLFAKELRLLQDELGSTMDLVTLSGLLLRIGGMSEPAAHECERRAKQMSDEVGHRRSTILRSKKTVTGVAWKRLEQAIVA